MQPQRNDSDDMSRLLRALMRPTRRQPLSRIAASPSEFPSKFPLADTAVGRFPKTQVQEGIYDR